MGRDGCSTGDLLAPHPFKPGRIDDQIILLTGEVQINPLSLETLLCESSIIDAAVIFGRSRIRPGVLLELLETIDASAIEAVRDLVWPSVERMNASAPPHCRISRHMIIFVKPDKPLVRNPKGYPKRPAALLQYQDEIDICYTGSYDPLLIREFAFA
ncbi:hypothetical protein H0H92_008765 [Tricholoma furcatifolium]|nr:hypothetical protein H0H92_008765 [Tricholoma furcatifolium]